MERIGLNIFIYGDTAQSKNMFKVQVTKLGRMLRKGNKIKKYINNVKGYVTQ